MVFAFMLAYTIMNGVSGPLIDRLGTRMGYGLCMAWWSVGGGAARLRARRVEPGRFSLSAGHRRGGKLARPR